MRVALSLLLGLALANASMADGIPHIDLNGNSYSNISKVYLSGRRVIITYPGGGTSATLEQLPPEFLESWGIGQDRQTAFKAANAAQQARDLDRAIESGAFRKVHGVVYDTRKSQSGWVVFRGVKVYQIVSDGTLIDSTPNDTEILPIFVRHLPDTIGDQDYISFVALPDGTMTYVNKLDEHRTVRAYDAGTICDRSEIPESVLSGKLAYDTLLTHGSPQIDVIAHLPDSDHLEASGSGFFITTNGYFITNEHVVRNARRVKLKMGSTVIPAKVVRQDALRDLALLKTEGQFMALEISSNNATLGQAVFTIGFPDVRLQGTEPKFTDGKVSSMAGIKDDPSTYQISVPVQPGNSGGPLVDDAGRVQGVVEARLDDMAALSVMGSLPQNVNYAIKGSVLREFLSQGSETTKLSGNTDTSSVVDHATHAVAMVLVY